MTIISRTDIENRCYEKFVINYKTFCTSYY